MEYLMTYGWAILIIAVVLGALFQLGVFNAGTFAPRAPPGACQVFRPNGPMSTSLINLEGVCSGELPQYVVNAGSGGEISTGQVVLPSNTFTVVFWTNWKGYTGNGYNNFVQQTDGASDGSGFLIDACGAANNLRVDINQGSGNGRSEQAMCYGVSLNTWFYAAISSNGATGVTTLYINGQQINTINNADTPSGTFDICGGAYGPSTNGEMANVQAYNTSLSAPEINALYLEGIGGAPIKLQNLIGWWPLNGNANDYSGNNNNGVPSSVTYTNQWTSGYTPP